MSEGERAYQIFVKPAGARCNLRCRYCYYLGKKEIYPQEKFPGMSDIVLERFIVQNIEASVDEIINFSWHGGEPLLAGIDFFKKAVELQKKHLPGGRSVMNGIQTNGTLLNDEWCRFLAGNGFSVGISIDGPGALHDANRITSHGKPSSAKVLRGFELLRKHRIPAEILCVVNAENVRSPLVVYNFFKQLGAGFITFLPHVICRQDSGSMVTRDSVPSLEFGIFLGKIFDEWVEKDIGRIRIQVFEEMIRPAFGQEHTLCIFKEKCGRVPVLEHNGDFYSCDHYVDNEHLVGNIKEGTITRFLDSEMQRKFGNAKSSLPGYCKNCEVRAMCNGECPRNRFIKTPDGEDGLNYLCEGYKYFFRHCLPFINAVAEVWKKQP